MMRSVAMAALVTLGTAMPLAAQDLCGGRGDLGLWVGGTQDSSDLTRAASPYDLPALAVPAQGEAVVLFTLASPADIRLEAVGLDGADPVIDIYSENGTLVLTDDDSGGDLAARGETRLEAGLYCGVVRSFMGQPMAVDLRLGLTQSHEAMTAGWGGGMGDFVGIDPCTAQTEAIALGNGPVDGLLAAGVDATGRATDSPYFRFTLAQPAPVSIRAINEAADPYIYLYDGNGSLLAENDDFSGLNSRIDMIDPLPAGDYCIGLRALADPMAAVNINLSLYDPVRAMRDLVEAMEASPAIGGDYPITDLGALAGQRVQDLAISGKAQWFLITLPQDGFIVVDAVAIGQSDPMLALYDPLGRELAFNDDSGLGVDSQIATRLSAGSYLLGIRQYDSSAGMARLVIERFVPAQ